MTPATGSMGRHADRGFVLVGVVMMVLALTIIGISLYSLSGYESQFYGRTYADRVSLYRASGGIEIVKRLISKPIGSPAGYRLSNAHLAEGREGIVSAVAWQEGPLDSTGDVDWNKDVHIKVAVDVWGTTRTVQGLYRGNQQQNPYHFVFTCSGPIDTQVENNNLPLVLGGQVWQTIHSASDTAWTDALDRRSNMSFATGDAPSPLVASYIATHAAGDAPVKTPNPDDDLFPNFTLTMDATGAPGGIRYFTAYTDSHTVSKGYLPLFDVFSERTVILRVGGTAVWVVPRGFRFVGEFHVEKIGTGQTTLIIVVGQNGRMPGSTAVGAWFDKGIRIWPNGNEVSVFLVSQGTARIDDINVQEDIFANSISVFADKIEFQGPPYNLPRRNMNLIYPNSMKALATSLGNVLPGYTGQSASQFVLRAGTWTEAPGLQ
jgi:hypothetical protein